MKILRKAIIILIIIVIASLLVLVKINNTEVKTIKSEKQLLEIMEGKDIDSDIYENLRNVLVRNSQRLYDVGYYNSYRRSDETYKGGRVYGPTVITEDKVYEATSESASVKSTSKTAEDYSTTNIQVENVDEADINKTDGEYIYSISDTNVVITDVRDPRNIKIASKINFSTKIVPIDLMLCNNKLIVIYDKDTSAKTTRKMRYYSTENTVVKTYDISSKDNPKVIKSFEVHQGYYTSRCIDNKLYVISSGCLRYADSDKEAVDRSYKEDGETKELPLSNIKYLKDNPSNIQTIIITEDLDNPDKEIKLSSFLMDVSNAYVSEESIYLLNENYQRTKLEKNSPLAKLVGWGGIYAFKDEYENGNVGSRKLYTEIYKFDIGKDGTVIYKSKNKVDGQAINQYSLDEYNGHLRIATYEFNKGAKITIFDESMKEIGHSDRFGENEKMYSTRFMGDRAYVVTYQTVDPLFVIDLSDEKKPKVLGELYIPGYSMYLHPYDESHIIGIGMETKETVNKDSNGRVKSTTARIVGMKMALFDVSDVRNPKQISQVVIGDSRTTSAILTNPKALLFSKEKELIAIPVNNYNSDFEISNAETYEDVKNSYTSTSRSYISEGYCAYKINLEEGFQYKGTITHEKETSSVYSYSKSYSRLLRGLYIDDNLYTISENKIKVNNLETLEQVSELQIKKELETKKYVVDDDYLATLHEDAE